MQEYKSPRDLSYEIGMDMKHKYSQGVAHGKNYRYRLNLLGDILQSS